MLPKAEHWESSAEVERDPAKVGGAWVFRGTRVPVAALFENRRPFYSRAEYRIHVPSDDSRQAMAELLALELLG